MNDKSSFGNRIENQEQGMSFFQKSHGVENAQPLSLVDISTAEHDFENIPLVAVGEGSQKIS